jgi:hypothetical protein
MQASLSTIGRARARRFETRRYAALVGVLMLVAANCVGAHEEPRNSVCRAVHGTFMPQCNGTICNQGKITGDLRGRFTSRTTSIYPAGSGWLYTAWTRIELEGNDGRLETIDDGITPRDAKGGPDLSNSTELLVLSQASGTYQDFSGTIVMVGARQVGQPTPYVGRLCRHTSP